MFWFKKKAPKESSDPDAGQVGSEGLTGKQESQGGVSGRNEVGEIEVKTRYRALLAAAQRVQEKPDTVDAVVAQMARLDEAVSVRVATRIGGFLDLVSGLITKIEEQIEENRRIIEEVESCFESLDEKNPLRKILSARRQRSALIIENLELAQRRALEKAFAVCVADSKLKECLNERRRAHELTLAKISAIQAVQRLEARGEAAEKEAILLIEFSTTGLDASIAEMSPLLAQAVRKLVDIHFDEVLMLSEQLLALETQDPKAMVGSVHEASVEMFEVGEGAQVAVDEMHGSSIAKERSEEQMSLVEAMDRFQRILDERNRMEAVEGVVTERLALPSHEPERSKGLTRSRISNGKLIIESNGKERGVGLNLYGVCVKIKDEQTGSPVLELCDGHYYGELRVEEAAEGFIVTCLKSDSGLPSVFQLFDVDFDESIDELRLVPKQNLILKKRPTRLSSAVLEGLPEFVEANMRPQFNGKSDHELTESLNKQYSGRRIVLTDKRSGAKVEVTMKDIVVEGENVSATLRIALPFYMSELFLLPNRDGQAIKKNTLLHSSGLGACLEEVLSIAERYHQAFPLYVPAYDEDFLDVVRLSNEVSFKISCEGWDPIPTSMVLNIFEETLKLYGIGVEVLAKAVKIVLTSSEQSVLFLLAYKRLVERLEKLSAAFSKLDSDAELNEMRLLFSNVTLGVGKKMTEKKTPESYAKEVASVNMERYVRPFQKNSPYLSPEKQEGWHRCTVDMREGGCTEGRVSYETGVVELEHLAYEYYSQDKYGYMYLDVFPNLGNYNLMGIHAESMGGRGVRILLDLKLNLSDIKKEFASDLVDGLKKYGCCESKEGSFVIQITEDDLLPVMAIVEIDFNEMSLCLASIDFGNRPDLSPQQEKAMQAKLVGDLIVIFDVAKKKFENKYNPFEKPTS